jgi:hypothetical protein
VPAEIKYGQPFINWCLLECCQRDARSDSVVAKAMGRHGFNERKVVIIFSTRFEGPGGQLMLPQFQIISHFNFLEE